MSFSVAWLSPFSGESDIGAFSRNLLLEFARPEIAREMAVTLLVNAHGVPFWTALPVIVLSGTDQDREILAAFDLVVYNMGNNHENHGHINRLALQVPGVVIVHDLIMQHYLAFETFDRMHRKDSYARLIGSYYGRAGLDVLGLSQICSEVASAVYSPWDSRHAAQMPLIEPFLHTAAAAVVHSGFGETAVRRMADLPLLRLQLPWDQKSSISDEGLRDWADRTARGGLCSVVCFGHISRNKCLDRVVQAFGLSDVLRNKARLTIAGYPGDRQYVSELEEQVRRLGLGRLVTFAFGVSNEGLAAIKEDADIFVNLREPNTESASGSLTEQMNTGRPVVIFPTGSYAEVPDGAAVPVAPRSGAEGVRVALEALIGDPARRIAVGTAGRGHVRRIGRTEYAAGLLRFLSANMTLLRARKLCATGRRLAAPDAAREEVGAAWLTRLAATRELFVAIQAPRHQIDIAPFRDWEQDALVRYIALGLFGQAPGSRLEIMLARVALRAGRLGLYRAVAEAQMLWCLGRMSAAEVEAMRPTLLARPVLSLLVYNLLLAVDPACLARGLYLGLLLRVGMGSELEPMGRRAAAEPVQRLVREIVRSDEFRRRVGESAGSAAVLLECENAVPPGAVFPPLVNNAATFGTASPDTRRHLLAGWHHLEEVGIWSRTAASTILFSLSPDAAAAAAHGGTLSVSVRFPSLRFTGPRAFALRINGGTAAPFMFTRDDWMTCTLDLPALCAGEDGYVLEFDVGAVINLAQMGVGKDTRDLGVRVREIEFLPGRPTVAPSEPSSAVSGVASAPVSDSAGSAAVTDAAVAAEPVAGEPAAAAALPAAAPPAARKAGTVRRAAVALPS